MNRKLESFPKKSITFRTATLIVVGVHVLAISGIILWSKHNSAIARQNRIEENLKRMNRPTSTDWPKLNSTPQIVAKPSPTVVDKKPKEMLATGSNTTTIKNVLTEATKKTTNAITQATTEKLKQEFLKTKNALANNFIQEPPKNVIKSTTIVRQPNKSPIIETFERQIISSSTKDIVISPQTVKTYVSNGVHYIQLN